MIPLGCSGSCQERDTLFLDVLSFLMTVMGDGAAEGVGGGGEGEKQTEFISVAALGKERGFHLNDSRAKVWPRINSEQLDCSRATHALERPGLVENELRFSPRLEDWWQGSRWF